LKKNNDMEIINKLGQKISLAEWQELYNLPAGSKQIGKFFSIGEHSIYDEGFLAAPLIMVLDKYRELKGKPVVINSMYRTQRHQDNLNAAGYRTATTSPHVAGMAADVDTTSERDTYDSVSLLVKAAKQLGIKIRLGYHAYLADGNTFIHVDVCPEYYAPGKPYYGQDHPTQWERAIVW